MLASHLKHLLPNVETALAALDAQRIECAMIQPADPFLDMAGENLRRRIFLTSNEAGKSLCLRPEFTIPVCAHHIMRNDLAPSRYAYLGEVFRQRKTEAQEFYQAGIEDLGDENIAQADAKAIAQSLDLVREFSTLDNISLILGDQAVFAAVLRALGLPQGWQERLLHKFGNLDALNDMIERLAAPEDTMDLGADLAQLADNADHKTLSDHLAAQMKKLGYSVHTSRAPEDIARRMIEKQSLSKVSLDAGKLKTLTDFLKLDAPLSSAVNMLQNFSDDHKIDISDEIDKFASRIQALTTLNVDMQNMKYRAAFGRPLDYYTGLVFEITSASNTVLAAGGRYDDLMKLLGAEHSIPAIGFSLWLDRLNHAASEQVGDAL